MTWRTIMAGSSAPAEWLLTWWVQSTALLAFGLLIGRWSRRWGPAVQSAVYRTTLGAVLLCPVASIALAAMGFSGFSLRLPGASKAARDATGLPDRAGLSIAPALEFASLPTPPARDTEPATADMRPEPSYPAASGLAARPDGGGANPPAILVAEIADHSNDSEPGGASAWGRLLPLAGAIVFLCWLPGTAAMGVRLLVSQRRMARLRWAAIPVGLDADSLCRALAGQMRLTPPSVLRTPFLCSPCLDGLRRPAILLPEDAEHNLRETFIHELAHLSRRDGLWNLLRRSATALLWVQPLVWLLSKRIEETAEEVCDDYVVEFGADRRRYAGHLLELAERTLPPLAPAGVGMISFRSLLGRRITRILDSSRTLSTRAGRRAIAATLLAGLAGTLLAGLLGVGSASREVLGDEARAEEPEGSPAGAPAALGRKTVKGRVVNPDGKPISGAKVIDSEYLSPPTTTNVDDWRIGTGNWPWIRKALDQTVTDHDGHFALSVVPGAPDPAIDPETRTQWIMPIVVAQAPGFGPDWWDGSADLPADRPLRLVRDDVPIAGRIIDLEGRPVAGATIQVNRIVNPNDQREFERWLEAMAPNAPDPRPEYWSWSFKELISGMPALLPSVRTDADGRFRLTGIGRDRIATLEISGPSIAFQQVRVITRKVGQLKGEHPRTSSLIDPDYRGASFTLIGQPGQPVRGVVRDAWTKAPIPGATITVGTLAGSRAGLEGLISAVSDAEGRYQLTGLPKGAGHRLIVYPSLEHPYFITDDLKTPSVPGLGPIRLDIELKRGIWISGRVTDAKTGGPAQAAIHYYPFLANEHAQGFPNFQPSLRGLWTGHRYRTDADGRYRVVGLPGRGIVAVKSFDGTYRLGVGMDRLSEAPRKGAFREFGLPTYNEVNPLEFHAVSEVNPPDRAEEFRLDLALQPGRSLTVLLVDPEGKPLKYVSAHGRFPSPNESHYPVLDDQSRAEITGLDSKVSRTVIFEHDERNLGATLVIKPGEAVNQVRTVMLRPCATVTGRLVDGAGKGVSGGINLGVGYGDNNEHGAMTPGYSIDADGRFRIEGLVPGASYSLQATDRVKDDPRMGPQRFQAFNMIEGLIAETGQVIDLGTFNAETGRRVKGPEQPVRTQDEKAAASFRDVPINGRVVDLEGRPIAGVKVRVGAGRKAKGGDLGPWIEAVRRGEPPWVAYRQLEDEKGDDKEHMGFVETDAQGRFRLGGLGAERVFGTSLEGPAIAYTSIDVVTRKIEPFPARGFTNNFGPGTETIYGADFTYTASPGRVVEGVVRDAKSKKSMGNVGVWSYSFAGSNFIGIKNLKTQTDGDGHFRLTGLRKGPKNKLLIVPNDDQPYFMQEFEVPDPPGIGAVAVEIGLHKGIFIEGKIRDKATGEPVAGGWLHYFPFLDNPFAQATPEFDKGGYTDGAGHQQRYQTKPDGGYRVVGLPGRGLVGVVVYNGKPYRRGAGSESIKGMNEHGHFPTWTNPVPPGQFFPTSMKEINPPEGTDVVHLDLELDPGSKVRLRVADLQGKPVTGVKSAGRSERGQDDREPQSQADFDVVTLGPLEERTVVLRQEERKIGRVIHVKVGDDKDGPVVVTLEPAATIVGRVVDADGDPVSGATVRSDPEPGGDFHVRLPQVASGMDGRFTVSNVPIGCEYSLVVESGATYQERRFAFVKHVAVRPGETKDVGEIGLSRN